MYCALCAGLRFLLIPLMLSPRNLTNTPAASLRESGRGKGKERNGRETVQESKQTGREMHQQQQKNSILIINVNLQFTLVISMAMNDDKGIHIKSNS